MNDDKTERKIIWWSGREEFAEEIEVKRAGSGWKYVRIEGSALLVPVPSEWLHDIPPTLHEGDLVYCWDGDERPAYPQVCYFIRYDGIGRAMLVANSFPSDLSIYIGSAWDHVEPVFPEGR